MQPLIEKDTPLSTIKLIKLSKCHASTKMIEYTAKQKYIDFE